MLFCRKFDWSREAVGKLPGPCVGTLQVPPQIGLCRNFAYASIDSLPLSAYEKKVSPQNNKGLTPILMP